MSFQVIYQEILEKVIDSTEKLYNEELLKKVHSYTNDYKWDFDKDGEVITVERANAEKEKGTKFFRNNQLQEACDAYTSFFKLAHRVKDVDEKERQKMLYQGYSNRSAVFFRAQKHLFCLDDIDAALHFSPDPKADYMIYDRRARCYLFTKLWAKAREAFNDALRAVENVPNINADLKAAFIAQVETHVAKIPTDQMIEEGKEALEEEHVMDESDFLIKLVKHHDFHGGLSSKIRVMYSETKGRYTVADEDIKAGEVIAVENANVSFTHFDSEQSESKACHECVKELDINRHPSPITDGIFFCSFQCMNKAMSSYHKHERHILEDYKNQVKENDKLERSGCLFLALKAIAKKPWTFYCENSRSKLFLKTDLTFGMQEDLDNLDKHEMKILHLYNLVQHEEAISSEERTKTAIRSIILLESLKQTGYFSGVEHLQDELTKVELVIGTLLYRLQLGFTHNVHLIYRLVGDVSGGIPLDMVGSAVYHHCVLLNHSCAANTSRFFQGGQMVLVAKRGIPKGEEVTNNYGVHHNNMTKAKRQSVLKTGYKFDCDCQACQDDYPLLGKVDSKLAKKVNKDLDNLIAHYQRLFSQGCLEEALENCCEYVRKLEQNGVKYPHRNYEIGSIAMNSCWWGIIARQSLVHPSKRPSNEN